MPKSTQQQNNDTKSDCGCSILSSVPPTTATADGWTREYDLTAAVTDTEHRHETCRIWLHRGLRFIDGAVGIFWLTIASLVGATATHQHWWRWVVCGLASGYAIVYGVRSTCGSAWIHHTCTALLMTEHLVLGVGLAVITWWDEHGLEDTMEKEFRSTVLRRDARYMWIGFAVCCFLEVIRWVIGEVVLYEEQRTGDGGMHEPLLWGWLEFEAENSEEARRKEWANRSAQDPIWWSREEQEEEPSEGEERLPWLMPGEV